MIYVHGNVDFNFDVLNLSIDFQQIFTIFLILRKH